MYKQKVGSDWKNFDTSVPINMKYKIRRIGGEIKWHLKADHIWHSSNRPEISNSILIKSFEDHKLLKPKISEQEIEFIKPLVDQAARFRKIKSDAANKDFFLRILLEPNMIDTAKEILYRIRDILKLSENARKERDFNTFSLY